MQVIDSTRSHLDKLSIHEFMTSSDYSLTIDDGSGEPDRTTYEQAIEIFRDLTKRPRSQLYTRAERS